jgi:hypothetical protein
MQQPDNGDLRGSAPMLTAKDLLKDLWDDMKFVRPAVETLLKADLLARIESLERDRLVVSTAHLERARLGTLTNKAVVLIVVIANFFIGLAVVIANLVEHAT